MDEKIKELVTEITIMLVKKVADGNSVEMATKEVGLLLVTGGMSVEIANGLMTMAVDAL